MVGCDAAETPLESMIEIDMNFGTKTVEKLLWNILLPCDYYKRKACSFCHFYDNSEAEKSNIWSLPLSHE